MRQRQQRASSSIHWAVFFIAATTLAASAALAQEPSADSPAPAETPAPATGAATDAGDLDVETPASPVPNSRALEESSLSNDRGRDEFKRPLLFDPADNDLQPENPQIKWDMDDSGNKINLGGLKLNAAGIGLHLDQTKRSSAPGALRTSSDGPAGVVTLSFAWPLVLSKSGRVTIESLDGTVAWSEDVTEEMRAGWKEKLADYKESFLKSHIGSAWGKPDLPPGSLQAFRNGRPFRVCLEKTNSELEKLRICTAPYAFKKVIGGRTQVVPAEQTTTATVALGKKAIGPHGLVSFPLGKEVDLHIAFANGATVDLSSQPAALTLLDVVESKNGREIILTGRLAQPLGKKKIVSRPESHWWAPSGIDQDTIWQIALPKETPTLRILGAFNLPFTFLFRYRKLPTEADRVFVREATTTGTYSKHPLLYGYSQKLGQISSKEESAHKIDDHHFEWTFAAPEVGARNKSRLSLIGPPDAPGKWVAHHRLYRGFPYEASARLSGVAADGGQLVLLGEVAANAWFESLGFTQNDLISRQRWGVGARYFRTLTAIQATNGVSVTDFSAMNADLKYNVVRGIWNRDQLLGVMGSLERVTIVGLNATLAGVGVYWARTMPRLVADLFDKFPLLDYSKYVDVEFVYYPVSASSQNSAGQSFNVNFHGKLFWTQRLYGEAGFGMRKYGFADNSRNSAIDFSTAYGNIGIGIIF